MFARSAAFMTENCSLLSGELWAPVTSALNAVPEAAVGDDDHRDVLLDQVVGIGVGGLAVGVGERTCAPFWSAATMSSKGVPNFLPEPEPKW